MFAEKNDLISTIYTVIIFFSNEIMSHLLITMLLTVLFNVDVIWFVQ